MTAHKVQRNKKVRKEQKSVARKFTCCLCPGSSMDRILDYGSNDEGSIPSRGTLKNYALIVQWIEQ